ncbi:[protein-PII] uridylyltransferase [Methylobacillus flagellatus]|uniref:Bifunctional uridylyltransferase/uridylyl-removing enzyme n=1 Tax=Methylobacillus flagellatus (strain ATCC 51484 / DSM 6875 / VKM B-1610 / KT) TaxID=265072 RepID=Q1H137_METFK|nr:[protein-PII] uridylyltransferase [Methylobacillus flagellatus]ABE49800.1 UTP-GlnB (protein PII) uridylyltransferase, GlnD [Methylobacillus flagellatus KT]
MQPSTRADTSLARQWRQELQSGQKSLKQAFLNKPNVSQLLQAQASLTDRVLRGLWQAFELDSEASLVAVGGYGRGELFPYSDVDILILLSHEASALTNRKIEELVGVLWDTGLAIGHSVRTLNECVVEAREDVTVQTNLLEARYLCGHAGLYADFLHAVTSAMDVAKFFEAKVAEQHQRHARFNDTAYNLEPNIKESPGGLRDLQNIIWIARALNLGSNWRELVKNRILSKHAAQQVRRHERNLQMLRTRLHYLANRREDRLLFDFQNELASQLGLVTTKRRRASEQLMHSFYQSAKFVGLINEILLQVLHERIYPEQHTVVSLNHRFEAVNGFLETKSPTLLYDDPSAILESFLVLQQHPELKGMGADLLRALHRTKHEITPQFRKDEKNKALFMQILQQPQGITHTLKLMNRYGVLGRYIPAFGRVSGQMQHDLFHVYTVDEHILNVLANLRRFALAEFSHEFPLCSRLFQEFPKPHLLYLGALFHDIAKGRGGDHSTLGAVDARRFCKQHNLPTEDGELVAWLVEAHLVMSNTAQKSDLSDPAVVEKFAHYVGSEYRLVALYLLTVADIRGTSPRIWNAWKGTLLESLFRATQRILRGSNPDDELKARQQQAKEILSYYGVVEQTYQPLWQQLGPAYFLRHEAQLIAWNTRLLLTHINTLVPIVRARLSPAGDGIQTMIYMPDQADIFVRICSFFGRLGYNIVEAKVHTTQHGYALDNFLILDQSDNKINYRDLLSFIEYELTQKLLSKAPPDAPVQGRISRQVKHMPIKPELTIQQEDNGPNTILDIATNDRPGLLSRIAHVLQQHHIRLHTAKINTLGNRVEDTFLIADQSGQRLTAEVLAALERSLRTQL